MFRRLVPESDDILRDKTDPLDNLLALARLAEGDEFGGLGRLVNRRHIKEKASRQWIILGRHRKSRRLQWRGIAVRNRQQAGVPHRRQAGKADRRRVVTDAVRQTIIGFKALRRLR